MSGPDATGTPELDHLGPADIEAAMALSSEANWNQTPADWALMMENGLCLGVRDGDGSPVASGIALPMGDRHGWISMVLVTKAWRRRGLATRIVEKGARWLERRGALPLLDATPDGAQVYERLGFSGLSGLVRWQRATAGGTARRGIRQADAADLGAIAECDRDIFGADRRFVLQDLISRGPAFVAEGGRGFLLGRRGRLATQVGPISAEDEETAEALLETALSTLQGPVFIDAQAAQEAFARHLHAAGFEQQRRFTRMVRGAVTTFGDPQRSFAAAGPELG